MFLCITVYISMFFFVLQYNYELDNTRLLCRPYNATSISV